MILYLPWNNYLLKWESKTIIIINFTFHNLIDELFIFSKKSKKLGEKWKKGVPIEVIPFCYVPIKNKIQLKFGGEAVLRMAKMKAVIIF